MKRILLLVAVLALVATACGGSAGADDGVASLDDSIPLETPDQAGTPEMTEEEALIAFTACLREQGLDIDDPTVDAEGNLRLSRPNVAGGEGPQIDRAAIQEACGQFLDNVNLGFQQEDRTEFEDQLLEFAACMRDNGYDMQDPDFSNDAPGQGGGPFGAIDRSDPAFQAAQEACDDILAGFDRGGGGGGGRGGGQGNGN